MYICVTHVDSITRIPCRDAPVANGPVFPDLRGLVIEWWNESEWPTQTPKYYGTCNNNVDLNTPGIITTLTEVEYTKLKRNEMYARKPHSSWVWNEDLLIWSAPVEKPWDGDVWDEDKGEWVMTEQSIAARITYYKQKLFETDYVGLSDYDKDKPDLIAQRQAWRDEIRILERA
jgi:dTDP-4-dehydrorhamnose 3,5-epimerase-like enzyme